MVTKVAVIGDPHLNSTAPASRVDDYPQTTLRKLADIRRICVENGVTYAILLGDVYHKNSQSIQYMNAVAKEFSRWAKVMQVYAIRGNHDLAFEKMESKDRSPLELLISTGIIHHLKTLEVPGATFHGFDYPETITKSETPTGFSICVAHRFYNYNLSDLTLTDKHIKHLGYSAYILGHDHMLYATVKVGDALVQRPGSLMRGTSHSYNLTREPSFDIDTIDSEARTLTVERMSIPYQPASEVFTMQALNKEKPDKLDPLLLTQQIDELIAKMDVHSASNPIYEIIDSIDMKSETKVLIEKYLTDRGLYRETVKENEHA